MQFFYNMLCLRAEEMYVLTQVLDHMGSSMDHPHEARTATQVSEIPHLHPNILGNVFMDPLTYKVFNIYVFNRCETSSSYF